MKHIKLVEKQYVANWSGVADHKKRDLFVLLITISGFCWQCINNARLVLFGLGLRAQSGVASSRSCLNLIRDARVLYPSWQQKTSRQSLC
jgi:hypothetical protein